MRKTLTTSAVVTQRDPKGRRFIEKVGACYDKAGLTDGSDGQAQFLNENPNFIKRLALLIKECSQPDGRFRLVASFSIVVPEYYNHATRLVMFHDQHGREFHSYNPAVTDANYAEATTKLVPGQRLKCKVFWNDKRVTSEDCLGFLESQRAILTGAQGASLAYEQGKGKLPMGRCYASFDEKEALWKDLDGHSRVPDVSVFTDGDFGFDLGYFEVGWNDASGLLCFCDE